MAGAAAISLGMVGTFAMPAYAVTPDPVGTIDGYQDSPQSSQTLNAEAANAQAVVLTSPDGAVSKEALAEDAAKKKAEADAKTAEAAQQKQAEAGAPAAGGNAAPAADQPAATGKDVPAGAGAKGIVSAALAQLGQFQDCTALVERSLRAIGIPAGDLGTQVGEYTALGGHVVSSGDYAPGDVLVWSGRHVAVYIGNGQAVHGGYGGNQTVVAGAFIDGPPSGVVRFG
ncbi:C40 family peptidase [Leucobacter sp. CSA2]|uniref:C40 family peptidase n=2 Tax=Leucobacter edaphi TaxID=2796472 RepID=A0A934Q957_9MICO|nr:C40 family peptidase [Leucobacter edaphi]